MVKGLKLAGIALAIIIGLFGLLAIWQWDTIRFVLDNYEALNEGNEWVEQIEEPEDLLTYIEGNPEKVAFYAIRLNDEDEVLQWRADQMQPVASVYKVIILAEVARLIEAGELDPDQMVPVEEVEAHYLPGTDGDAHQQAFAYFEDEGLIRQDHLALREVIQAMIRWSDNAATDYLIHKTGRDNLEELIDQLDHEGLELPFPINGAYLLWENNEHQDEPEERLETYLEWERDQFMDEAYAMSARMKEDEEFRNAEQERLDGGRLNLSLTMQRSMATELSPKGSARAYAEIMRDIFLGTFISEEISGIMQEFLEWPMTHERIQEDFMRFGTKGGSLPGVLTSTYYGRSHDGDPVMLSLLFTDMQFAVWFHFMQQHMQQDFEIMVMKDPEFWDQVDEMISDLEDEQ